MPRYVTTIPLCASPAAPLPLVITFAQLCALSWLLVLLLLYPHVADASSSQPVAQPALPTLSGPANIQASPPPDSTEQTLASLSKEMASIMAAQQPQYQAQQQLSQRMAQMASRQTTQWLNQFGTAQVTLGTQQGLKKLQGSLALLLAIDEADQKPLTFTQWNVQQQQDQTVLNIGLGQRYTLDHWLLGYNFFFDHNLRRSHSRFGLGSEAWTDYLHFSGNGYFPISSWKKSPDLKWYQEKPAYGFDIHAQGYWPCYPFIGGKIMYEHYFGDEVGLFSADKRQKNPLAVTLGVNYTPFPLLTVGVDHRRGSQGQQDTRLNLQLKYAFATPWQHHLAPEKVAQSRTLPLNLYSFVQRNNNIVLQYRKQNAITLILPAELHGYPGDVIPLQATVEAALGLNRIEWQATVLEAAGGNIGDPNGLTYPITLPAGVGRYPLRGIAYDNQGNASDPAETVIVVDPCTTLQFPARLVGIPGAVVDFNFHLHSQHGAPKIDWQGSDQQFKSEGGIIDLAARKITLPGAEGSYHLTAVAIDPKGHRSTQAVMEIIVSTSSPITLTSTLDPLPDIWLSEGIFTLTATGGNETYHWVSDNLPTATVDPATGATTTVAIDQPGDLSITVNSPGAGQKTYSQTKKPLLKIYTDTQRAQAEGATHCGSQGGHLPTIAELRAVYDGWGPIKTIPAFTGLENIVFWSSEVNEGHGTGSSVNLDTRELNAKEFLTSKHFTACILE